jgi:hypothetical protein
LEIKLVHLQVAAAAAAKLVTSNSSSMVEKLHSQLAVGAEASAKVSHYQEVIEDLKAMLQGKWVDSSAEIAQASCHVTGRMLANSTTAVLML